MTFDNRMNRDTRSIAELIEDALIEQASDEDPAEGEYLSICVLHHRGTREVLDAARALCRSQDPRCRELGAEILGQLGGPEPAFPEECCDALLDLVRDEPELDVRIMAIYALGHLGNRRRDPELATLRNHPDRRVRRGVAFSLNGSTSPEAVQALLELMDDPYEEARDWATTGIGHDESIDGTEVREALWRRARDESAFVRAEALNGLARRGESGITLQLIREISNEDRSRCLFDDAAVALLGLDEMKSFTATELLAGLKQLTVVR